MVNENLSRKNSHGTPELRARIVLLEAWAGGWMRVDIIVLKSSSLPPTSHLSESAQLHNSKVGSINPRLYIFFNPRIASPGMRAEAPSILVRIRNPVAAAAPCARKTDNGGIWAYMDIWRLYTPGNALGHLSCRRPREAFRVEEDDVQFDSIGLFDEEATLQYSWNHYS